MAITELYAVTEVVSTTEWSFTTDTAGPDADTTDGIFQIVFDVSTLVKGDKFEIRFYEKANSGGTQRRTWTVFLANAQTDPLLVFPSLVFLHGWDVTIIRTAGADRSIIGSIRQVT